MTWTNNTFTRGIAPISCTGIWYYTLVNDISAWSISLRIILNCYKQTVCTYRLLSSLLCTQSIYTSKCEVCHVICSWHCCKWIWGATYLFCSKRDCGIWDFAKLKFVGLSL